MNKLALMTVGGGCFWCTEAIFDAVKGVKSVVSGYAGGKLTLKPTYETVCSGMTGYAEVVQVFFDDTIISYEELLLIFMTTHDPTTLNRQGNDRGSQYRSVIFYHDEKQKKIAKKVIEKTKKLFVDPIITEITPLIKFFISEDYHHDYYKNNLSKNYCRMVISPKLSKFRALYKEKLKQPKD